MDTSNTLVARVVEVHGPGQLVITANRLDVSALQPDEVAAVTLYTAVSPGTEVAAFRGDRPLRPSKVYPRVVGYCNVARIVATGTDIKAYRVGDTILTLQSHRSAFICSETEILTKLPVSMEAKKAAVAYLYQLGYNALLNGGLRPGHNIAVIGLGTLGLTTIVLGARFGHRVFGFSNQEVVRPFAERHGARAVFRKDDETAFEAVGCDTFGTGVDLVVTTSNDWSDWVLALKVARPGGTIAVLGFPGRNESLPDFNPLDSQYFYDKQLTITACGLSSRSDASPSDVRFTLKRNIAYILDLLNTGAIPAELMSTEYSWHELENVYMSLMRRKSGHAIIKWDG